MLHFKLNRPGGKPATHYKAADHSDTFSFIFGCVQSSVYSVFFVVLVLCFIVRLVGVDGSSMQNTLQDGDRVVISGFMYTPRQGDIVVVSRDNLKNDGSKSQKPIIKRIIAVGGQSVDVCWNGSCYEVKVDGVTLNEPYIRENMVGISGQVSYPYLVPDGHVFVMGDNRNNSLDSRKASVGAVDERLIIGRAYMRLFPLDSVTILK